MPIDTDSQYLALQIYQMVQGDDEVECVEEIVNETESFCRPVLIIGDGGVCRYRPPVPPPAREGVPLLVPAPVVDDAERGRS